jgi:hypothetical protein
MIPASREQVSELVATRPPFWEFLLFAGVLWREMQRVEPKWLDYTRGILQAGPLLTDTEALALVSTILRSGQACIHDLVDNFESAAQEAFGAPGSPGDPIKIENLGVWVIARFNELVDLATAVRRARTGDIVARLLDPAGAVSDQQIRQLHIWVDRVVKDVSRLPEAASQPGHGRLSLDLSLTLGDDESAARLNSALEHLEGLVFP